MTNSYVSGITNTEHQEYSLTIDKLTLLRLGFYGVPQTVMGRGGGGGRGEGGEGGAGGFQELSPVTFF